jgi:putative hydrolase of the HAD superfamily
VPDAIFFDMDDTLVLSQYPTQTLWEAAIGRFTGELGGLDIPAVYKAILTNAQWYWDDLDRHRDGRLDLVKARREITRMAFTALGRTDFALSEKIADDFSRQRESDVYIAPGTIELLKSLRERGIKLAMITNGGSDIQRSKINQFGFEPYFENILIEGEFGTGKPDERVFLYTLEKLKVKPAGAWMVGDNLRYDIAPCRALGIFSVWVNGKSDTADLAEGIHPDKTITTIAEIPGML